MPRPKPPEKLLGRQVRMSDRQWIMFNELGGADWLRKLVEKKALMPKKFYDRELERLQNPADAVFLQRRKGEIND